MYNKYNLTKEQNIFLAKRNIVDNIYANARMEGLNITFPQALFNGPKFIKHIFWAFLALCPPFA